MKHIGCYVIFALSCSLLPMVGAEPNLVINGDFESGSWTGNAWQGKGEVGLSSQSPAQGAACLRLAGLTPDAQVQAISSKIEVESGGVYAVDCVYRCPQGKAQIMIRWSDAGVVYGVLPPTSEWATLSQELAANKFGAIFYGSKIGSSQDRRFLGDNRIAIPPDIHSITISVHVRGENVLEVDDITFVKQ